MSKPSVKIFCGVCPYHIQTKQTSYCSYCGKPNAFPWMSGCKHNDEWTWAENKAMLDAWKKQHAEVNHDIHA